MKNTSFLVSADSYRKEAIKNYREIKALKEDAASLSPLTVPLLQSIEVMCYEALISIICSSSVKTLDDTLIFGKRNLLNSQAIMYARSEVYGATESKQQLA